MSIKLTELVARLNEHLKVDAFKDYSPNGLQIEGRPQVSKLMTGVTASQALIDEAVRWGADALLVHHGYFWKGEPEPLVGMKGRRVKALMQADISLLAYHLPLDAHPELGNNQQLAERLGLEVTGAMDPSLYPLGLLGKLAEPLSAQALAELLAERLGRQPLYLAGHQRPIQTLAWCTGAAEGMLVRAAELGVDAYISGEVSERTLHEAQELGIDYFAAGHHATERYGVQALGHWIAESMGVEHRFVDLDNPV